MSQVPIEVQVVDAVASVLEQLWVEDLAGAGKGLTVQKRMLTPDDPNPSASVFLVNWRPVRGPGIGSREPDIMRYQFSVQTYLKSIERAQGELASVTLTKRIRNLVYRDGGIELALRGMYEDGEFVGKERLLKFGFDQIEYADIAIAGAFAYFSQAEFFVETEVT